MIVVRDEFQLKFGVAREATSLFQEGMRFTRSSGAAGSAASRTAAAKTTA